MFYIILAGIIAAGAIIAVTGLGILGFLGLAV